MFWESGGYQFNENTCQGQKLFGFRAQSIAPILHLKIPEENQCSLCWVIPAIYVRFGSKCVRLMSCGDSGHPSVHWPQGGPRTGLLDTIPLILIMSLSTPVTICVQWTANRGNTQCYGLKLISEIRACTQMNMFQEISVVLQPMCCFMAEHMTDVWPASLTAWVRGENRVTSGAVSTTQTFVHMWVAGRLHCFW